jgi:ribose/xylose/arabinose/galactoside ABC-type transport system permease subunit
VRPSPFHGLSTTSAQRLPRFAAAAAQAAVATFATRSELMRLGALARSYGIYLVLIALLLVPSLWLSEYRGVLNLGQIVQQSAALAILAIGQTFVIACRMIDLSVGQLMGLIVVASCGLMDGRPEMTVPAILLALAIGLAVGAINGFLNNRLRIHSLILTLGMLSILQGVIFVYTDRSVGAASPAVLRIGNGTVMGVPVAVPLVLVVAALAALLLHHTRFGLYVRVVGGNEEGARRAGIDVARVKLPVFILSGISAAIAGIILAGRLGTGYPNAGTGFELDAIVAVVLGGTPLSGGRGTILGTLAAVLVLGVTANLLNLLGMSAFIQMVVKGLIVIAAVLINQPRAPARA